MDDIELRGLREGCKVKAGDVRPDRDTPPRRLELDRVELDRFRCRPVWKEGRVGQCWHSEMHWKNGCSLLTKRSKAMTYNTYSRLFLNEVLTPA